MGNSRKIGLVSKRKRRMKSREAWTKYKERTGQDLSCALTVGRKLKADPQYAEKADRKLKEVTEKLKVANEDLEASRAACYSAEQSLTLAEKKNAEYEKVWSWRRRSRVHPNRSYLQKENKGTRQKRRGSQKNMPDTGRKRRGSQKNNKGMRHKRHCQQRMSGGV
ncbi:unnamed protein product [Sphacelaria rigidula]